MKKSDSSLTESKDKDAKKKENNKEDSKTDTKPKEKKHRILLRKIYSICCVIFGILLIAFYTNFISLSAKIKSAPPSIWAIAASFALGGSNHPPI